MHRETPFDGPWKEKWAAALKMTSVSWKRACASRLKPQGADRNALGIRSMFLGLVIGLAIQGFSPGCGISKAYHQDDLRAAATRHHVNLRWGRIPNAANTLHPDLQAAFVQDWETKTQQVEIKDIEIVDLLMHENQNEAMIQMQITYLTKDTLEMKSYATQEKWRFVNDRWIIMQPAALPPKN